MGQGGWPCLGPGDAVQAERPAEPEVSTKLSETRRQAHSPGPKGMLLKASGT